MHPNLRIRVAQPGDRDLLAQWAIAMAWETEHKRLDPATIGAGIAAGIADPNKARYFIAMSELGVAGRETIASAAGTLMLTREWSDWRCGEWWWIQSVYVPEAHRRQGVFAALYRHVKQLARATTGVVGLRLYVERDNAAAQRSYEALGMRDAGYRIFESEFAPRE
ncbi:GNAT family N-acetyltransferase [Lysobacter koreensis]|uniref:GNAT family N-acetyltransferase n=1 Tax=Lysobacter koreensis TaxID=266122 RepID=A0ABW2YSR2_9GAMM